MKFNNDEEIQWFIIGEKFYKNDDCYCLGRSLDDAAYIIKIIMARKERTVVCGNGF